MVRTGGDSSRFLSVLAGPVNLFVCFVVWIARLCLRLLVHVQAKDRIVRHLLSSNCGARAGRIVARRTFVR